MEIGRCCDLYFCDLMNLPWNPTMGGNIGYAFVNFSHTEEAQRCALNMSGRRWTLVRQHRECQVRSAHVQGIAANLDHFVLCALPTKMYWDHLPLVFSNGGVLDLATAVERFCSADVYQVFSRRFEPTYSPHLEVGRAVGPPATSQCVDSVEQRATLPWPERLVACRPSWAPETAAHMSRQVLACSRAPSVTRQMHDSADHQAHPPWPERLVNRFPHMTTTTAAVSLDETALICSVRL